MTQRREFIRNKKTADDDVTYQPMGLIWVLKKDSREKIAGSGIKYLFTKVMFWTFRIKNKWIKKELILMFKWEFRWSCKTRNFLNENVSKVEGKYTPVSRNFHTNKSNIRSYWKRWFLMTCRSKSAHMHAPIPLVECTWSTLVMALLWLAVLAIIGLYLYHYRTTRSYLFQTVENMYRGPKTFPFVGNALEFPLNSEGKSPSVKLLIIKFSTICRNSRHAFEVC